LTGVVEIQDLHHLCSGNLGQRALALHTLPYPLGPTGDTLHYACRGGTEQPQIAAQQCPDGLGVPNEHIIERQPQAIGVSLIIQDVDHQQPGLTPGCRKTVASLRGFAAAVRAPGAHAAAIEADADPLACQWAIGRDRQTEGCLKCGIA